MSEGVCLKVRGVAEDTDEDVFGCYVEVEAGAYDEADETDAVGDHFGGLASALVGGVSGLFLLEDEEDLPLVMGWLPIDRTICRRLD